MRHDSQLAAKLVAFAILAAPASAAPSRHTPYDPDAVRTLYDFSHCMAAAWRRDVMAFLGTVPESQQSHRLAQRIVDSGCLHISGELKFNSDVFRAALYESVYKAEFGRRSVPDFSKVPPLEYSFTDASVDPDVLKAEVALRRFAECVVRSRPAEALALLNTQVTSKAEAATLADLAPTFSSCVLNGQVRFSKTILRGLIAESLYRLSRVATGLPPIELTRK